MELRQGPLVADELLQLRLLSRAEPAPRRCHLLTFRVGVCPKQGNVDVIELDDRALLILQLAALERDGGRRDDLRPFERGVVEMSVTLLLKVRLRPEFASRRACVAPSLQPLAARLPFSSVQFIHAMLCSVSSFHLLQFPPPIVLHLVDCCWFVVISRVYLLLTPDLVVIHSRGSGTG